MASLGTITLAGKSGSTYEFSIYNRTQEFREVGALYVMSKKNTNGKYAIIYVGQTGNLSERPLNHHKTACFDKHGADLLLIKTEDSEKRRLSIESDLVDNYNPSCNG